MFDMQVLERLHELSLVEKHSNYSGIAIVGLHDQLKAVGKQLLQEEKNKDLYLGINSHVLPVSSVYGI
jgi:hypothetical protein